jgi:hypothetical protein
MVLTRIAHGRLVALLLFMTAALAVGACGSQSAMRPAPAGGGGTGDGNPGSMPAASAAPTQAGGGNGGGSGNGSNSNPLGAFKDEAQIVRTGSMTLQVANLDSAVNDARNQIRAIGGYVGASRQTNDGDNSVATITYRIPSDRWDDALTALRKLGKVLDEQTDALEVTGQLIDLQARIDNLRASEKALQAIAQQATKIPDVLEVQNQLSGVRGQIEELDAQRSHLSDQATYGTLAVAFGLEVKAVVEASKGWDPGDEVDRASASLIGVLQALTSAGIWFAIVWLPILLTLAVILLVASFVLRRLGVLGRPANRPPLATDA